MELLPLKTLWKSGAPSAADYVRFLRSILENVPVQTGVQAESAEEARFRSELTALSSALNERSSCDEISSAVNAGIESIKAFGAASVKRSSARIEEMNALLRAMTETITFLSESRTSVVHQLNFIERELEQASELEDIRLLRPKMLSCLEMVRQETSRLQNESATHSEVVRSQLGASPNSTQAPRRVGSLDPVTGLPGRQVAERVLNDKVGEGKNCVLALFLASRLSATNRIHGKDAGDEVLLHVAQHLAIAVRPPAMLCRWSGPAFVAFVEAGSQSVQTTRTWKELAARPFEKTLELGRRSILLPIKLTLLIKEVTPTTSTAALFEELERFITQQTGEKWA